MNGVVNFLKPVGMTSSDAVMIVKRTLGEDKVGHLGTLDPLASGVLPIAFGKCTSLFDLYLGKNKEYRAFFDFSYSTDTLDNDGEVLKRTDKKVTKEEIEEVLPEFVGKISQMPPKYSAKSINGVRAYKLARAGVEVGVKPEEVEIFGLTLVDKYCENGYVFDIKCSSGTYIRSIARDLGQRLGALGTMTALIRTSSGIFSIESSVTSDELKEAPAKCITTSEQAVGFLERLDITGEKKCFYLKNGVSQTVDESDGSYRLYLEGEFYGVIKVENNKTGKITRLV